MRKLDLALLALLGASMGCAGEAEPVQSQAQLLDADDRIAPLIAPCGQGRTFTADTSDMTRVLANSLVFSEVAPLRRARTELAELGDEAFGDLRRVFDDAYADKWQHGVLENVLGVCALSDSPGGMDIIRAGLRHPNELVRLAALDGARKHGGPEDYEGVLVDLNIATTEPNRADFASALYDLDPERFFVDLLGWFERRENTELWSYLALSAAKAHEPAVLARYARLVEEPEDGDPSALPDGVRPFLIAAMAASGDAHALDELRALLTSDLAKVREITLRAVEEASLILEVRAVLEQDDLERLRARAAKLLGEQGDDSVLDLLRGGLSDPGASVRTICLEELIKRGDGAAMAQALEMLRQGIRERSDGMRALRLGWGANPEAPRRAHEILTTLLRENAGQDDSASVGLLQHLSQVPTLASAEFLMNVGRNSDGVIRGWPAHRWCAFQTYNVGPVGLAYLRDLHAAESDPFRRLDYLAAIWQDHSDEAREVLRGVVQDERSTPQELLYAAGRLVQIGPASEQAPFLKRAIYFASTHEAVRPALQCLLWRWYGS